MLLALYLGALGWLNYLEIPGLVKFALAVLLVLGLIANVRRHVLFKHPQSIVELYCHGDEWDVRQTNGKRLTVELLDSTFVSVWLVVLNFRVHGEKRPRSVVIVPGATDSSTFRRLNVRLRRLGTASA